MTSTLLFILGALLAVAGDHLGNTLGNLWYLVGYAPSLLLWAIALQVGTESKRPDGYPLPPARPQVRRR
jgi:hypothetical protein